MNISLIFLRLFFSNSNLVIKSSIREKNILAIGMIDYCLLPYFACFANKVVTITSEGTKEWYGGLVKAKFPDMADKIIFKPHFNSLDDFFETNTDKFDVVVVLDKITPAESKNILVKCCLPTGYMIVLNRAQCFDKRSLTKRTELDQKFEIIENPDNVKHIMSAIDFKIH